MAVKDPQPVSRREAGLLLRSWDFGRRTELGVIYGGEGV